MFTFGLGQWWWCVRADERFEKKSQVKTVAVNGLSTSTFFFSSRNSSLLPTAHFCLLYFYGSLLISQNGNAFYLLFTLFFPLYLKGNVIYTPTHTLHSTPVQDVHTGYMLLKILFKSEIADAMLWQNASKLKVKIMKTLRK